MLDGYQVEIGNLLWDILRQQFGTVTNVFGQEIWVDYGGGQVLRYGANGTFSGAKRLYWLNPVITLPQKDDSQWSLIQAVVQTIRSN